MKRAWLVIALAAALIGCGEKNGKQDVPKPRLDGAAVVFPSGSPQLAMFSYDTVKPGGPQTLRVPGRLVWNEERTVRLYPAFAGRVARILVKPGDPVKPGQTLAVLASPDFGQVQAEARRAESDFALAEKNLARLRELLAAGVAPRKDLNAAEADFARAEAERERTARKVALYGSSAKAVDQWLTLASPIAGVVVERNINPGQELRTDLQLANAPAMFVITDPTRLWVMLDATERDLPALARGKTVALRAVASPEETFTATIDAVADFVDPTTRTIRVRGSLRNLERKLKGEMYVMAELDGEARAVAQVPSKAVFLHGERHYIYVEESPGRFTMAEVRVDGENAGVTGIISGVSPGQRVVVEGSLLLQRTHRQLSGQQAG